MVGSAVSREPFVTIADRFSGHRLFESEIWNAHPSAPVIKIHLDSGGRRVPVDRRNEHNIGRNHRCIERPAQVASGRRQRVHTHRMALVNKGRNLHLRQWQPSLLRIRG